MRKGHASLLFVIDRSGSMGPLVDDTIGGFNTVLEANRAEEGTADVTLVLFDHEFLRPVDHADIKGVAPLDRSTYVPRGMTALLDAIGIAVSDEMGRQAALAEDEKPERTIVTIITDGQENASKEWGYDKVRNLLTTAQEERHWVVTFLGANIDAAAEARRFGIDADHAVDYHCDPEGTALNYEVLSETVKTFRSTGKLSPKWKDRIDEDYKNRK